MSETTEKEFLSISDMIKKLECTDRKAFWRMRKRGEVAEPIFDNPKRWRAKDVDNFNDERVKSRAKK